MAAKNNNTSKTFAQAVGYNPENLLKLREAFPKLPNNKITKMHNVGSRKPPLNIKSRSPLKVHLGKMSSYC